MRYAPFAGVAAVLLLLLMWHASTTETLMPARDYFTSKTGGGSTTEKNPPTTSTTSTTSSSSGSSSSAGSTGGSTEGHTGGGSSSTGGGTGGHTGGHTGGGSSSMSTGGTTGGTTGSAASTHRLEEDIWNSTLGFEKIFAVSMAYRTDRRDGIQLSAALTNLDVEFIDGVDGSKVPDKAIPKPKDYHRLKDGQIGCWRSHMNVMNEIIRRNLSSALVMEDDADWDIRIKEQMFDFGKSMRALIQPLAGTTSSYMDPSYPKPQKGAAPTPDFDFDDLPDTVPPTLTPYGDDWDLIWTGHCGMSIPGHNDETIPHGRVVRLDNSVPEKDHLFSIVGPFLLKDDYPAHTRLAHHVTSGVCTVSYAVSQRGARRLLYEAGLRPLEEPIDLVMNKFCTGGDGRRRANCLAMQPAVFQHHRPAGDKSSESDIDASHKGYQENAYTDVIRWSVRLNAERIIAGEPPEDQFPDDGK